MFVWKTFDWIHLPFKELEVEEGETRYYVVDENNKFPSVTSILSLLNDGGIESWKKRVGEEEADRIVKEAIARGENLHYLSEQYLMNKLDRKDVKGPGKLLFNRNLEHLNQLGPIVGIEVPLYNIKDKYAGRADCIAFHGKDLCIVDHKNSRRQINFTKKYARKKIFGYMLQCCAYARAFHEMFPSVPAPSYGILIVGNVDKMNSRMYKFPIEPLQKELDILLDAYYNKGDIKRSSYFKM